MLTFAQKYAKNHYSQFGEDGIIEEILKRLEIENGCIAEFGAHNGTYCSNSAHLIDEGWKAVLIEASKELAIKCWEQYASNRKVQVYCDMVTPENVGMMLWNDQEPFTILSIDVDGIDAAIWKEYHDTPDIVIIEINSNLDPMSEVFADPNRGSSYKSMVELGLSKGYFLLCHTGNCVFVKRQYVKLFPEIYAGKQLIDPILKHELFFNTSWQNK